MAALKHFIKNFLLAIPLAIGLMFSMFSVVFGLEASHGDNAFAAFVFGLLGIPLLFASIVSLTRDPHA